MGGQKTTRRIYGSTEGLEGKQYSIFAWAADGMDRESF